MKITMNELNSIIKEVLEEITLEEKLNISTKSSSLPLKNILNSGSFIISQYFIGLVNPGMSFEPSPS